MKHQFCYIQQQRVSVPYRGATFLNDDGETVTLKASVSVSVPYRGATFLNWITPNSHQNCTCSRFPSPIGELHFSINWLELIEKKYEFPSPIGELHFSIWRVSNSIRRGLRTFPSPIGELHFSIPQSADVIFYDLSFPSPIGELHFSMCKRWNIK